jgi:hypothetical protein
MSIGGFVKRVKLRRPKRPPPVAVPVRLLPVCGKRHLPERGDVCGSCGGTDTFRYDDPDTGPELCCMDCTLFSIERLAIRHGLERLVADIRRA